MYLRTLLLVALTLSLSFSSGQAASAEKISGEEALRILQSTKFEFIAEKELPASVQRCLPRPYEKHYVQPPFFMDSGPLGSLNRQAFLFHDSKGYYLPPPPGTPGDPFNYAGKGDRYYWVISSQPTTSASGTIRYYYLFEMHPPEFRQAELVYVTREETGIGSTRRELDQSAARFRRALKQLSGLHF